MSQQIRNITDIQEQLLKSQAVLFMQLREEVLRSSAQLNSDLLQIIDILINQTYDSYKDKNLKIHPKYLGKLKALSVLSYFYGLSEYNLTVLAEKLSLTHEQVLRLLIQLSISKLIVITIDQFNKKVTIHSCLVRQRQSISKSDTVQQRLLQIKDKNDTISKNISSIIEKTNKNHKKDDSEWDSSIYQSLGLRSSYSNRL